MLPDEPDDRTEHFSLPDTGGTLVHLSRCPWCIHKHPGIGCTAFPGGIPAIVSFGHHDHKTELPGDGGLRFERNPDQPGWPGEKTD